MFALMVAIFVTLGPDQGPTMVLEPLAVTETLAECQAKAARLSKQSPDAALGCFKLEGKASS